MVCWKPCQLHGNVFGSELFWWLKNVSMHSHKLYAFYVTCYESFFMFPPSNFVHNPRTHLQARVGNMTYHLHSHKLYAFSVTCCESFSCSRPPISSTTPERICRPVLAIGHTILFENPALGKSDCSDIGMNALWCLHALQARKRRYFVAGHSPPPNCTEGIGIAGVSSDEKSMKMGTSALGKLHVNLFRCLLLMHKLLLSFFPIGSGIDSMSLNLFTIKTCNSCSSSTICCWALWSHTI